MSKLLGNRVGVDVCKALNLDPSNVAKLRILLDVSNAAQVEITRYLTSSEVGQLVEVFERYEVTKVKDDN